MLGEICCSASSRATFRLSAPVTAGWPSSIGRGLSGDDAHAAITLSVFDLEANEELPAVHRVTCLLPRRLPGTDEGAVGPEPRRTEGFTFRFTRRGSRWPGLLLDRLFEKVVTSRLLTDGQLEETHRARGPGCLATLPRDRHLVSHLLKAIERPWRTTP